MNKKLKILIVSGILPPLIGGPAQYAIHLRDCLIKRAYNVGLLTFNFERYLSSGIRHIYFFFKVIFNLYSVDFILSLDTFSVGFPSVLASKIFNKKIIIRTGGDFLWENYIERTNDLVLLRKFYSTRLSKLSSKEKIIYKITKWTLRKADAVIFSTEWQRDIFMQAYDLNAQKIFIVENFYGEIEKSTNFSHKVFIGSTRPLKWKNLEILKKAFAKAKSIYKDIELDTEILAYNEFVKKIQDSYATILVSLGDISPNMILDSIRFNKPFILTRENGLMNRIGQIGIFVDPENGDEIAEKILFLSNPENYKKQQQLIENFNFRHSWDDISEEILAIAKKI